MKHQYKVGDLVRVKRHESHGVKFGAICELTSLNFWYDPENPSPTAQGPIMEGWDQDRQILSYRDIKPAKQAMAEREALRLLDAGNIPKPGNKSPVANRMRKHIQAYANRRG